MSTIEQAKDELQRINFGADDTKVMIEIIEKFFAQWDSGGAVACVAPILGRLIAMKPLSPLTGMLIILLLMRMEMPENILDGI